MKRRFFQYIKESGMVTEADTIVVGCSGGPDSMALLALLHSLQSEVPFTLLVAHLNHSIRSESIEDSAFVDAWCRDNHIHCISKRIDIPSIAKGRKISLELAAREERHKFFQEVATEFDCSLIALGHHMNDQSETILHRIVRGTGISGLCGMRVKEGLLFRPLLHFSHAEIVDWLQREGIPYRIDQSNSDTDFTRNKFRHQILPELSQINTRVSEAIVRLGVIADREENYWQQEVQRCLKEIGGFRGDEYFLCRDRLKILHPAVQYRLIRQSLCIVRGDLASISEVHLDSIIDIINSSAPQSEWVGPDTWIATRYEKVWIRKECPAIANPYCIDISKVGYFHFAGGSVTVSSHPVDNADEFHASFPVSILSSVLQIRSFLPGDRMLMGSGGRKKVKEIFAEHNVWHESRSRVPLLVSNGMVVWIPGIKIADNFLGKNSEREEVFFRVDSGRLGNFVL